MNQFVVNVVNPERGVTPTQRAPHTTHPARGAGSIAGFRSFGRRAERVSSGRADPAAPHGRARGPGVSVRSRGLAAPGAGSCYRDPGRARDATPRPWTRAIAAGSRSTPARTTSPRASAGTGVHRTGLAGTDLRAKPDGIAPARRMAFPPGSSTRRCRQRRGAHNTIPTRGYTRRTAPRARRAGPAAAGRTSPRGAWVNRTCPGQRRFEAVTVCSTPGPCPRSPKSGRRVRPVSAS